MLVVKVYMWPGGDKTKERLQCQATLDCIGVANHDDDALGVREGERAYRVRLLKGVQFGGPNDDADVRPDLVPASKVWRQGIVRGHRPNGRPARGAWDIVGGALKVLLGNRLNPYADGKK